MRIKDYCVINVSIWPIPSQVVEHSHVGIGVVEVVGVRWVVFFCPVRWHRAVKIENVVLGFRLIVHAVEAHHLPTHMPQTNKKNNKATIRQSLSSVKHQDSLDFS